MFLEAFRTCGTVSHACEAAGISRDSHYKWLAKDPQYAADFADAQKDAIESLEAEARRRAVQGVRRLKFHSKTGEPYIDPETGEPYYEHVYSDTLLIFLLKGAAPEKYRDNVNVAVRREYSDEELDRFAEQQGLKLLSEAIQE